MGKQATFIRRAAAFAKSFTNDPFTHWPFTAISRQLYGNLSGFRQNLYGSIHTRYHRIVSSSSGAPALDQETLALAWQLRRTGMAITQGWLDPELVERIRNQITQTSSAQGIEHSEYMTLLEGQQLAQSVPEIFDVFDTRIRAFLQAYFGGSFFTNSTSFRLTRHIPDGVRRKGEVYSNHWHTDSGPTSGLAMFVLLKDLEPDGGPTAAIDIAATKAVVRKGYASRLNHDKFLNEIESDPSKIEMIGPAGTILFVNVSRCLHRAGIPAKGRHREWLQFRLFPCTGSTNTKKLQPAKIIEYTNGIKQVYGL